MPKVSPLAPDRFPEMPPVAGVQLAVHACGLRYKNRDDLLVVKMMPGSRVAGVLTRSQTAAAPVEWCRKALMGGQAGVLVVNSGNANAFTGGAGDDAVYRTVEAASEAFSCEPSRVFIASTGVIGEPLPTEKLITAFSEVRRKFDFGGWEQGARAIMTTDTFPKGSTRRANVKGTPVTINGIAKGSGMIAPDMATMLAFVFSDAAIAPPVLQMLLSSAVDRSFNCITVDGDTSTSDTVLLFATCAAGHATITDPSDVGLQDFRAKLDEVMLDLAHQVIRDGEGASKFVTITVAGAAHDSAARRIGLTVANSPLVKTAIAGEDANWGRIVMAVGRAGEKVDRDLLSIKIGGVAVSEAGAVVPGYDEAPIAEHMKGQDIDIFIDVGIGSGRATVWTCDLTHGYIDINADYRT